MPEFNLKVPEAMILTKEKVLEYLRDHPNAWTIDVHKGVCGSRNATPNHWVTMALLNELRADGKVTGTRTSNNNYRWSLSGQNG